MTPPAGTALRDPIAWYYLATPIFLLMDLVWGVSVRVSALDDTPGLKLGYYALCLACGGVMAMRPKLSGVVGVAESSVNVLLIMLPYFRMLQALHR